MTRDFLTVRVWDTYMEKEPIQIIPVHDSLRKQLAECTENDIFFDRFNVGISPDKNVRMKGKEGMTDLVRVVPSSLT